MHILSASIIGSGIALFGILAVVQWRDVEQSAFVIENPAPPADLAQSQAARIGAEKRLADAMATQITNWPKADQAKPAEPQPQPQPQPQTRVARIEPSPAPSAPDMSMPLVEQEALLNRVGALLHQGDIGAARAVLNRLVRENNPRAAFLLAQSYDPEILKQGKVVGMRPDPALARSLYEKALRNGVTEAKAALDALPPP